MTVRGKLNLKGMEDYLERLAAAGQDVDAAADRALEAGGQVVLKGELERVPRLTGNLADHLQAGDPQADGNFHSILIGLDPKADADTARYGNANEFGTAEMAAQPFIRPTLDEEKRAINAAMRESLQEDGKL